MCSAGVDYSAIISWTRVRVRQAAGENPETSVNKWQEFTSKVETCPGARVEYERRGRQMF